MDIEMEENQQYDDDERVDDEEYLDWNDEERDEFVHDGHDFGFY